MAKPGQRAEINSFVKGLITEASELNFPADAFADAENFELKRNGTINRRLGMDYESGAIQRNTGLAEVEFQSSAINTFRWLSVAGDTTRDFLVIQIGQKLSFYDLSIEPLSAGFAGETVISQFSATARFSFASLEGRLVVVSGADTVAIVTYPAFSIEYGRLLTRDVWGLEETEVPQYETDPSFRTSTPSGIHYYNLYNQSWGIPRKNASGILLDPVEIYTELGVFPSNSEQVWPGLQFQAVAPSQTPFERIYSNLYEEVIGANVETARGYFIIDALRRGQSRTEQFNNNKVKYPQLAGVIPPISTDLTSGGVTCITDFAGRIFYSGFNGEVINPDKRSPEYSNYVFFSQIVKSKQDFFKCYQEGDPTSRENTDLVDTDGGFIRVSGAKQIVALRNLETSLIIFATNGIWSVTGGSDFGFSATNYKATKISSYGALSDNSIVVEGGRAFFWAEDGIYSIGRNELGDMAVQNMTVPTIQRFYESISNVSKLNATGSYDILDKTIRWIFKDGTPFTSTSVTKELVFDSALNAFSVNKIINLATNNVEVFSLFRSSAFVANTGNEDVGVNADNVLANLDQVIIPTSGISSGLQSTRYLIVTKGANITFTFGQYRNAEFLDWKTVNGVGVDAFAFGLTGVQTAGDSAVKKQIPYLVFHMYRTETLTDGSGNPLNQSGCKVQYRWSFSDSSVSKKFSPLFQVYRYVKPFFPANPGDAYDNGFSILTTKNKVRGMGRSFQMYFQTEPGKDCRIVGWSLTINGNSVT